MLKLCEQRCELKSARSHRRSIISFLCCSHASHFVRRCREFHVADYWQASHVGSSIAQNLMSVAGTEFICTCAAAAAASSALMPCAASPPPEDTALRRPDCTVD